MPSRILPELRRNKNTVRFAMLDEEGARHGIKTDAETLIVYLNKKHVLAMILRVKTNRIELVTRLGQQLVHTCGMQPNVAPTSSAGRVEESGARCVN